MQPEPERCLVHPITELITVLAIFILMPMVFLSDAETQPDAMPAGLREVMNLSPLYYFIEMGYGILLKGAGLDCWA